MSENKYLVMPCTYIDDEYENPNEVLVVELTKEMREGLDALQGLSSEPLPLFGEPFLVRHEVPRALARIYVIDVTTYEEEYDDLALLTESDPFEGILEDVDGGQAGATHTVQVENVHGYLRFISFEEYGPTREYAAIPPAFFAGQQEVTPAEELHRIFTPEEV
jgi:hypothetical protein